MTTDLVPYQFKGWQQRIITDEHGVKWWVAQDTCKILGLGNITEATRRVGKGNYKKMTLPCAGNPQKTQSSVVVNERGLRSLIVYSNKPVAFEFKDWALGKAMAQAQDTSSVGLKNIPESYLISEKMIKVLESLIERVDRLEKGTETKLIPQYTAGQETGRATAVRLIADIGKSRGYTAEQYRDFYNDKFDRLSDRHHINIHLTAQRRRCKQIEVVEQMGLMPEFISIIKEEKC